MSPWNLADHRLSDRDRRAVLRRLRRAHGQGRLDDAELAERTDAVATARTFADAHAVLGDLGGYGLTYGPHLRRRRFPFAFPFFPLLVVAIVLAATGHVPWLPVLIVGGLVLVLAPWRRRHWGGRYGYAC